MPNYSVDYRKQLKLLEAEIDIFEKIVEGKIVSDVSFDEALCKERLKLLKRYRALIIDNPQYNEGRFDPDFSR